MLFLQTNYFFVVSALAFLTGLSVCYATTSFRIWPKGLILPILGVGLTAQSIYLPVAGSDVLLIGAIGVALVVGSGVVLPATSDATSCGRAERPRRPPRQEEANVTRGVTPAAGPPLAVA